MGSSVTWMKVLSAGMGVVMGCRVRLVPAASTTSACLRKWYTGRFMTPEALPSASGWDSGNALLPPMVVTTGTRVSSANSSNSGAASA